MNAHTADLKADLIRIATDAIGADVTVVQVVEFLYAGSSLTDKTIRGHVLRSEFMRLMEADRDRTASDIEKELAARYDVSQNLVEYYRNEFARGGRRQRCGPRRKVK